MAIGEPEDFRTPTFLHVERFPGQMTRGGTGSGYLPSINPPSGESALAFPPFGIPGFQGGSFNFAFPQLNIGPPSTFPGFTGLGGGGGGLSSVTVTDATTTLTGIDTINFKGSGLVGVGYGTSTNIADVEYQDTGGGGGSTLVYGKISAYTKVAGIAQWTYTVTEYVAGAAGASLTMYNLLEKSNTATNAYGYTTTGAGGDQISGTQLYVKPVPVDAWVRAESTNDPDGGTAKYWFSAPNPVDGTCT